MAKDHYVDNELFYSEMCSYIEKVNHSRDNDLEPPAISEYIGKCFLDISIGLSGRPNFLNYTFKDDMVSDGVENCIQYCSNFSPEKSKNPFAYFTQIVYYAFVRRIERESKQSYVKHKLTETLLRSRYPYSTGGTTEEHEFTLDYDDYLNNNTVVDKFEEKLRIKKEKTKKVNTLEKFME
jgi:hypothetical protein